MCLLGMHKANSVHYIGLNSRMITERSCSGLFEGLLQHLPDSVIDSS